MSLVRIPILRHGLTKWDKTLLSQSDVDARVEKVRSAVRAAGLDALLVYGDMANAGSLAYLTNFQPWDARMPGFVLVTPSKLEAVVKVTSRDLPFIQTFVWADAQASDFLAGDLAGQVRDLIVSEGLERKRVGFAGAAFMPQGLAAAIAEIFPNGTVPADALVNTLRREKSVTEDALMRLTATKAEAVISDVSDHAAAGMTEVELAAFADYAARKAGALDVDVLLHSAADKMPAAGYDEDFPFRPPSDRRLAANEQFGVFIALQFHGYWTEVSQSIVIGAPRPEQKTATDAALASFDQLRAQLGRADKPEAAGTSFWVHGIGLDREEEPHWQAGTFAANDGDTIAAHVAVVRNGERAFFGRAIACAPAGGTLLTASIMQPA